MSGPVHTSRAPLSAMIATLQQTGTCAAFDVTDQHVDDAVPILALCVQDMKGDVSGTERLEAPDAGDPTLGSWRIAWADGSETTVTVMNDGASTTMGSAGAQHRDAAPRDQRLVTVRHVRSADGGLVLSTSASLDPDRLGMPDDAPDGRRPVHVARTLVALIHIAMADLRLRRRRGDPTAALVTEATIEDETVARVAGLAAVLDAGREDVLELPAGHPDAVVALRYETPLAPARCTVGPDGSTAVMIDGDRRLPHTPLVVSASASGSYREKGAYLVASLSTSIVMASVGGHDPVSLLRLTRMAEGHRSHPETRR